MPKDDDSTTGDEKDITLHDVIVHVDHMGQRLTGEMKEMEKRLSSRIDENTKAIKEIKTDVAELEEVVVSLGEDLTATMKDTYQVRKHVGLVAVDDE